MGHSGWVGTVSPAKTIMLKRSLLSVLLAAGVGLPANALPSCYMIQADGVVVDLTHMCQIGGPVRDAVPSGGSLGAVVPVALVLPGGVGVVVASGDVWTRNIHFRNSGYWDGSDYVHTIVGNIHNSGFVRVEDVVIEATGYAEGRTPQTRRETISAISSDDAASVTFDFGFSVPVESWDVRIVE